MNKKESGIVVTNSKRDSLLSGRIPSFIFPAESFRLYAAAGRVVAGMQNQVLY